MRPQKSVGIGHMYTHLQDTQKIECLKTLRHVILPFYSPFYYN